MNDLSSAPAAAFADLDEDPSDAPITLQPIMRGDLFIKVVNYPIIVESWDRVVGRHTGGRHKRRWLKEFSEAERKTLGHYQQLFRRWYLSTGTPKRVSVQLKNVELLQRAVEFFASVY